MIKLFAKGKLIRFCKGLSSSEFDCKCEYDSCRGTLISSDLIKAFEAFRNLIGVRMIINSGYRCALHNFAVEGKPLSQHMAGQAIDISLKSLDHLTRDEIKFAALNSGFTYVLFYKTFVHLDVR